jgi:hypothetical protein
MDELEVTTTESTTTETASPEAPQAEITSQATTQATPEAQAYQPNFKFKSYDLKDAEFDEYIRPVIKDKDTEEKIRDLYTKAYALEPMKSKYNKTQEELSGFRSKYDTLYQNVNRLGQFLDKEDFDNFFHGIGAKEDQIFKWALKKLQIAEDPMKLQAHNELTERRRNEILMTEQYRQTQAQLEAIQSQQRAFELDQNLSRPDIKAMVEAYESKVGQPGSFRGEVIRTAQYVFNSTGKDMSPEEAINEVLNRYKPFLASQGPATTVPTKTQSQSQAPVIPNVTGRSTSPTARQIRSLDDLKKLSQEMD